MEKSKNVALVAHDNRKKDLEEWVEFNYKTLLREKYEPSLVDYSGYIARNVL